MPGARCIRAQIDGGQLGGGAPRVVWLTLGADPRAISVWSAAQRLNQENRPTHLVWDPLTGDIDIDHLTRLDVGIARELPGPVRTNGSPVRLRTTHELRAAAV